MVQVLVGSAADAASLQPLVVSNETRAEIRLQSALHDPAIIGDPGTFFATFLPQGASHSGEATSSARPSCHMPRHGRHGPCVNQQAGSHGWQCRNLVTLPSQLACTSRMAMAPQVPLLVD